jgi:hypothetical protein
VGRRVCRHRRAPLHLRGRLPRHCPALGRLGRLVDPRLGCVPCRVVWCEVPPRPLRAVRRAAAHAARQAWRSC